jgi:molecular chaperone DnaK (HSP70)
VSEAKYLVGIDLGTSNCAMAWVEPARGADAPVTDFPIYQLERPSQAAPRSLLPSCLYLPSQHEMTNEAARLPWGADSSCVVGEFARWQGARVPGRLVSSAKSWLCHPGVDRSAPILPWGAPVDVPKISPVEASARLLGHMRSAWDFAHPETPLNQQEVILTVPASFDEAARALTVQAARQSGLEKFTLIEEPQAAFYDFTARHRSGLASALENIRLVLVVDVGGGTSDFTLVQVGVTPDGPAMRRIAVGEHLMLGGDNMDAAVARRAEERLVKDGRRLSGAQWAQLTQVARSAKEHLLSSASTSSGPSGRAEHSQKSGAGTGGPGDEYKLAVAAEGSRLVGGSMSTHLTRAEVEEIVLNGFLPLCVPTDRPQSSARVALQELGLPYAQDPSITRHLAAFLKTHAEAGFAALGQPGIAGSIPRPEAILLNGGVFNSPRITERLLQVVSSWWPDQAPPQMLRHESLDLAVARGAAFYGLVRKGLGRRIGGGSAHALYVGLERAGTDSALALCVVPRGQEEGETVDLGGRVFQLAVGRPVRFPLFSTSSDRLEKAGDVIPVNPDLQVLPPIHTLLKSSVDRQGTVPVHLQVRLTEIGTLELWCVSNTTKDRWRLEFELRGAATDTPLTITESMPPSFAEARLWIERLYGKGPLGQSSKAMTGTPPKDVKQLWASLERTLGPREEWRLPVLRELWSVLFAGASRRRRSADHERIFFQLLGYTLRPGFGYPLDEWRCEQTARLFPESIEFHKEKSGWKEFWIFWRRICGGLAEGTQGQIWAYLKPFLEAGIPARPAKHLVRPKGVQPEGLDEMARLGASLEHLEPAQKVQLGGWIADRLRHSELAGGPWTWALGRLGARVPIYGSVHRVVDPSTATAWVQLVLEPGVIQLEGALFALSQMARLTGDRIRDLDEPLRIRVLDALRSAEASPSWQRMVSEVVALDSADKARALGDSLPVGLLLAD